LTSPDDLSFYLFHCDLLLNVPLIDGLVDKTIWSFTKDFIEIQNIVVNDLVLYFSFFLSCVVAVDVFFFCHVDGTSKSIFWVSFFCFSWFWFVCFDFRSKNNNIKIKSQEQEENIHKICVSLNLRIFTRSFGENQRESN